MIAIVKRALPFVAASALLCAAGVAHAGGPIALTDGQLDRVAAGAFATVTATGEAIGLYTQGGVDSFTVATGGANNNSPWSGTGALASGAVGVVGSNLTSPGESDASVTTSAGAAGNWTYQAELNKTTTVNGTTIQIGFTYAVGAFVPGVGIVSQTAP